MYHRGDCFIYLSYMSHLMMDLSDPNVTTVASVAWSDINLAKASEVLL